MPIWRRRMTRRDKYRVDRQTISRAGSRCGQEGKGGRASSHVNSLLLWRRPLLLTYFTRGSACNGQYSEFQQGAEELKGHLPINSHIFLY